MRDDYGVVEDARSSFVERDGVKPKARAESDAFDELRFRRDAQVLFALEGRRILDVGGRDDRDVLLGESEGVGGPLEIKGDLVGGVGDSEAATSTTMLVIVVAFFPVSFFFFFALFFISLLFFQVGVDVADGEVVGVGRCPVGSDAGVLFFFFREKERRDKKVRK